MKKRYIIIGILTTLIAMTCAKGIECDQHINLDPEMWVVGDGCYSPERTTDSQTITVPVSGNHEVLGLVHRGNPDQCQIKEEFYTTINGVDGPVVTDKENPCDEVTLWEPLGTFPFNEGSNTVHMTTAAHCPPDEHANSVDMSELCIRYETTTTIPEMHEYSNPGTALIALLASPALAYLLIRRR